MEQKAPPPVLDCGRVISYAIVEDLRYRQSGRLYVGDELIEHVPALAICMTLGDEQRVLLFHCDCDWNVLGVIASESVVLAKSRAEQNYPAAATRWLDLNTSVETAFSYYDTQAGNMKCSFCGKRPFEFDGPSVESGSAVICSACIYGFYHELQRSV